VFTKFPNRILSYYYIMGIFFK